MPFSKLVQGFKGFHEKYFIGKNKLYHTLIKKGQSPDVLMIACSDSRNDPALITSCEPGDMFVIRNVAAIVPPYAPDDRYHGTSAAIEFAVKGLKVKDIVVMGHALCGGVSALLHQSESNQNFEFLSHWIKIGNDARNTVMKNMAEKSIEDQQRALEQSLILTSLNNLMTFPWISEAVNAGKITLHGWYFDMTHGQMLSLDFSNGEFKDISSTSLMDVFLKRSSHYCTCTVEKFVEGQK